MTLRKLFSLLLLLSVTTPNFATVFYSKQEAMELAFGKGTPVENLSLFPDDAELAKIQQQAKMKLESGMFSFYVGKNGDKVTGYAAIETETVRTNPETLLIVLSPEGELRAVHLLAFHEPPEYQPPERWFDALIKQPLAELEIGKGVDGVSGATLSTRSALGSVRKVMALYQVMVKH
jgi:hypothetical protein